MPEQVDQPVAGNLKQRVSMRKLREAVEEQLGPIAGPFATGRTAAVITARHIWMYLCREAGHSLHEIGLKIHQHHTTVYHGALKIAVRRSVDPELDELLKKMAAAAGTTGETDLAVQLEDRRPRYKMVRLHPDDVEAIADVVVRKLAQRQEMPAVDLKRGLA